MHPFAAGGGGPRGPARETQQADAQTELDLTTPRDEESRRVP